MAADDDDDMEWHDYEEQMPYPKSDEDGAEYEFPELVMGFEFRGPEFQSVGTSFPNIANSHEYESEAFHVRCHSPRRAANSNILKAMPTTIPVARSACGAEGWRIGMSASEMKKIFNQEEKLNQMMCPRSVLTSASSCRKFKGRASRQWLLVITRAIHTHSNVRANPQRKRSIQSRWC